MNKEKSESIEQLLAVADHIGIYTVSCGICGLSTPACTTEDAAASKAYSLKFEVFDDEGMGTVAFCKECAESAREEPREFEAD